MENKYSRFKKIKLVFDGEITPWLLASKGSCIEGVQLVCKHSYQKKKQVFYQNLQIKITNLFHLKYQNLNNLDELVEWIEKSSLGPNYKLNKDILENEITFLKKEQLNIFLRI